MAAALAAAAIVIVATSPRRPRQAVGPAGAAPSAGASSVAGAFHIHTTRSDGALDKNAVAAAVARAGLRFAIFTEHGDGTVPPDPPAYLSGVLALDAVEISTNDGHYIALDMRPSSYPLGGDGAAVAEDVQRLGGFGIAAHPLSNRRELAWTDWDVPLGGLELINLDSAWRDESRLALSRAVLHSLWRPAAAFASLLDRPVQALERWDALTANRPVVGFAGHDAHGGIGAEADGSRGRRIHMPSYEATFRTFSLHATVPRGWGSDAVRDADSLVRSLREGRIFTAIDTVAQPAALDFRAEVDGETLAPGSRMPPGAGPATFRVRAAAPAGAETVLLLNGEVVATRDGGALDHVDSRTGAYRVEVRVPDAPGTPPVPWLISNPIYRLPPPPDRPVAPEEMRVPLAGEGWRSESSAGAEGRVDREPSATSFSYRLPEGSTSQFAALVVDLDRPPADASAIVFRGLADHPMRVSVQLRFPGDGGRRWVDSVYLDPREQTIVVPLHRLRPADGAASMPPVSGARSLLFVVDLTNARPGAAGRFTIREVGFLL